MTALGAPSRSEAFRYCRHVVLLRARNFYHAFRFLPGPERRAMFALYAFCRTADDLADEPHCDEDREEGFARLERGIRDAATDGRAEGLLFTALAPTMARFGILPAELEAVLEGCRMDTHRTRYETRAEIERYCYLVAGVVGAMTMRIFGVDPDLHPEYVRAGGTAVQMTNILRDVAEDAERGRIYLPQDALAAFGVAEDDILARRATPEVRRLLAHETDRVRELYATAARVLPRSARYRVIPLQVIQRMYPRILDEIEHRGYDVFGERIRIPGAYKLWAVLSFYGGRFVGLL